MHVNTAKDGKTQQNTSSADRPDKLLENLQNNYNDDNSRWQNIERQQNNKTMDKTTYSCASQDLRVYPA